MKDSTAGSSDAYPTFALLRRLLVDEALVHWPRYALASLMMAVAAAATALGAYFIGTLTNEAYLSHNFRGIVILGVAVMAIFAAKGLATYFGAVMLSHIGNRIVADNQRRMFEKLLRENMSFFADRHSSEFIARLTTGAQAVSSVINLLITAIGRDLMSLIGLCIVMVTQDPVMSIAGFVAAPPAIFFLRKLARRVRNIARMQFTGGTRIIETMQEALQGLRMVKAFSLEDEMQRRLDASVASVESEANKMARVSNRGGPLMETLGGIAVALAMIYGGYRGISGGGTPGQFVSFLAAFLLAYEPAKRLARLNMDLNNNLVGVRVLYEIIDSPPGESKDDDCPPLKLATGRLEFADVRFAYRPGTPVLRGMSFVAQPGKLTALVGPSGGGKSTVLDLILRFYTVDFRPHPDRQPGHRVGIARLAARPDRLCRPGRAVVPRHDPREYRAWPHRRQRSRDRRRGQGGARPRIHLGFSWRLRHSRRRAWHATLRRPAPAHRHCARADQERADHPAR